MAQVALLWLQSRCCWCCSGLRDVLQKHMGQRFKFGFSPPRYGRRGEAIGGGRRTSFVDRIMALFDPTVTMRTIINEGAVFGAFALW